MGQKKLLEVETPRNIVKVEENGDIVIIKDNNLLNKYTIINNTGLTLNITDNKESFLFDNQKIKKDIINIDASVKNIEIYSAVKITMDNFYLDKGNKITVGSQSYYEFEKIGNDYYYNQKSGNDLVRRRLKIHINKIGNIIDIE